MARTNWHVGTAAVLMALCVTVATARAQPLATRAVATGLSEPLFLTAAPGDPSRLFVVQRAGLVRIVKTNGWTVNATPYLDMTASVILNDENAGLLSIAFDPAYATSGLVYTSWIAPDSSTVITRHHVSANPDVIDPASATLIWKFARPQFGHNGGFLGFSPTDGFLYLSSGDGGIFNSFDSAMRAQDITNQLMGKILRINPATDAFPGDADRNYSIPAGNPFVGITGDDEIWAYGLRNPWRCSFDRSNGDFWIADVGQDAWEEVDYQAAGTAGRNYGWRCMEAQTCTGLAGCTCNAAAITLPLHSYNHSLGLSITGGYVYRGGLIPALQGAYLYGDFVSARVWSFVRSGAAITQLTERTAELAPPAPATLATVASFGEDSLGELYICEYSGGAILKIVPPTCPVTIGQPPLGVTVNEASTLHLSVSATGLGPVSYRWKKNGVDLIDGGAVLGAATSSLTITPVTAGIAGSYGVRVWNTCGAVESLVAPVQFFCRADVDQNGLIQPSDVALLISRWLESLTNGTLAADFDGNGAVQPADVAQFVSVWFATIGNGGC